MNRIEFENKYLNKLVEVKLFNDDIFRGRLYSTNDLMKQTNRLDMKNYYFIGDDILDHGVRFRKSYIKKIRLASCVNVNKTYSIKIIGDNNEE